MGRDSLISWTDDTRNFWIGCTEVPGARDPDTGLHKPSACDHCYAKRDNEGRWKRAKWGKGEERFKCNLENAIADMRRSNRLGEEQGYPRLVFLNSASDAFDEEVPDAWRDEMIFDGVAPFPHVIGLLLTKRTSKLLRWVKANLDRLPRNLAFGTTVATQDDADQRLPQLVELRRIIPWPITLFISMEPLLERVDIWPWASTPKKFRDGFYQLQANTPATAYPLPAHLAPRFVDWVLTGGESGYDVEGTRPILPTCTLHVDAVLGVCEEFELPLHHKQWGEWAPLALFPGYDFPNAPRHVCECGETFVRIGARAAGATIFGRGEIKQFPPQFRRPA